VLGVVKEAYLLLIAQVESSFWGESEYGRRGEILNMLLDPSEITKLMRGRTCASVTVFTQRAPRISPNLDQMKHI
jgi:hypothetical protein